MIRRFNYTSRQRIKRKDVRMSLRQSARGIEFDADLGKLVAYSLPPEALVFVEAHRQTAWMRFPFGTVGAIVPEKDRRLVEFDTPDGVYFRVKVTSPGDAALLLAEADGVQLAQPDEAQGKRKPLLPVKAQPLGEELYRVDYTGVRPMLLVNSEVGDYVDIALSPPFMAVVYPAVLKELLTRVIVIDKHDDTLDDNDWRSQWMRFAVLIPGLGDLPECDDVEGRLDWVEKAVTAFATRLEARSRLVNFLVDGGA